ncbi:hypothetical protein TWF730_000085 [Orbilia blumenaviensis]|uniref:PLD phosphodiesterase domain-containing protein n=1 Tax=Orbilia blumenaviensis TaxID=1796055 RepID=A0AAV9VKH0_9PEZI
MSQIYLNVLKAIGESVLMETSNSIVAASGTVPLTIISTVPDIADHYYNLIIEATAEIIIFSNFWKFSYAARRIGDALRMLSRKAGQTKEPRIAVKIMFDRGSIKHILYSRVIITEPEWVALGLPPSKEIPNIDLEVLNYHNFPLGTLHSKFMVIDKKVAILNSCNIQDNSNLEMMCQFEGPIVNEIWGHAIATWGVPTDLNILSANESSSALESDYENISRADPLLDSEGLVNVPSIKHTLKDITEVLNRSVKNRYPSNLVDGEAPEPLFYSHSRLNTPSVPMFLAPRAPYAGFGNYSINTPQNIAWLSAIYFAKSKIFIQTPDLNAEPVVTALLEAVKRGIEVKIILCLGYNDLGEMLPTQGGHNEWVVARMKEQLNEVDKKRLKIYWYVGRDMVKPVHALKHFRTCHIKLMIVDGRIGIQGSGNQDSQSWFHSQEVNMVIDSEKISKVWMEQLGCNQNSMIYGLGSEVDGIWRDYLRNQVPGSIGPEPGPGAWVRAVVGLLKSALGYK